MNLNLFFKTSIVISDDDKKNEKNEIDAKQSTSKLNDKNQKNYKNNKFFFENENFDKNPTQK